MNYYQELTILPDPEITAYFVWSKLFTQLHIALADVKNNHGIESIAVSFPEYHFDRKKGKSSKLGLKLRVFAPSKNELDKLNLDTWLERLTDYVHIKKVAKVADKVGDKAQSYVSVQRYRFKPVELQAKTLAEKLGVSYDKALETVAKRKHELKLPFINLHSHTNNVDYHLQILQQSIEVEEQTGDNKNGKKLFNAYGMTGMSEKIAVPHW